MKTAYFPLTNNAHIAFIKNSSRTTFANLKHICSKKFSTDIENTRTRTHNTKSHTVMHHLISNKCMLGTLKQGYLYTEHLSINQTI